MKNFSKSEENGLRLVDSSHKDILSVGISTGGVAEIEMARRAPRSHIVATTIDVQGATYAKSLIEKQQLSERVEVKIEDVSEAMHYQTNSFDFIYARLVLHYLSSRQLEFALSELHRVLRPKCMIYIVVRSTECDAAKQEGNSYDKETGLTEFRENNSGSEPKYSKRFFHTIESISSYIDQLFRITDVLQYDESLYTDFKRSSLATWQDNVIQLTAVK